MLVPSLPAYFHVREFNPEFCQALLPAGFLILPTEQPQDLRTYVWIGKHTSQFLGMAPNPCLAVGHVPPVVGRKRRGA
jgi:hypothetical protein